MYFQRHREFPRATEPTARPRTGPRPPHSSQLSRDAFRHPGVLAAKVRDFGSNLLKCARAQMGTKRAKVGHLAPGAI